MTVEQLKKIEVLNKAQYSIVVEADPTWAAEYLFHNFWNDTYLNLEVYSEVDKEEYDFRRETGYDLPKAIAEKNWTLEFY